MRSDSTLESSRKTYDATNVRKYNLLQFTNLLLINPERIASLIVMITL